MLPHSTAPPWVEYKGKRTIRRSVTDCLSDIHIKTGPLGQPVCNFYCVLAHCIGFVIKRNIAKEVFLF